jgi:trk system potassium uptake protein TrkH
MKRFDAAFLALSWVIMAFSFAFMVPGLWDLLDSDGRDAKVWTWSFAFTFTTGLWLWARTRGASRELSTRDGFLLVTLVWVVLPAYASIPFLFKVEGIGFTRAYFEAMSGLSATGATSLAGLDLLPPAINVWRCFMQLIGGLGIMLLAVAVLPFLGLGGMQLYKAEMPGPMKDTRLTPRIAETARGLWSVYFSLSLVCFLAYRAGGMSWADAFMHMCSTVGLGGFSSHDQSFAHWNSPTLEWLGILFMLLSGISFARYFVVWRQRSLLSLWLDPEVRAYVIVIALSVVLVYLMLQGGKVIANPGEAIRIAAFQVVSLATTTSFTTADYGAWPSFLPILLLFLGVFVSCAGSTGGGIKMIRMLVLVQVAKRELTRILHPRAVLPLSLMRRPIPEEVVWAVMAFMLIYGGTMVGLTLLLLASGLDVVTAFTAVIGNLNNIGPGLGTVGPSGNYAVLSEFQLWICALAMLLGRLELMSVLVLFTPHFWRR